MAGVARSAGHDVLEFNRADFDALAEFPLASVRPEITGVDAVVFCSGVCPVRPVALSSDELLAEIVRVNCGLFLSLVRTLVAGRLYNPEGMKAVAISSVSAVEGWAGGSVYCASKGALSAMCRAMDAELKPKRISVTALEPRYVRTKMFEEGAGRMGVPASAAEPPEAFAAKVLSLLEKTSER